MDKTVVELFAGVGGFRCGFNNVSLVNNEVIEEDNWDFVWANQWEPSTKTQAAYDCYVERFGNPGEHSNEDIATVPKNEIPKHTLLVGGFPCQDYSVARSLSNEKGIEGKKGVLWWEIAETLEVKRPPFVLLENVDRLLRSPSTQRGRDFAIMLRTFLDYGYSVEWRVINAAEYGFPQRRRRVFIFAYHKATKYFSKMNNIGAEDIIYKEGIFAKNFPIKYDLNNSSQKTLFGSNSKNTNEFGETKINKKEFKDVVEVSDNFVFHFFNAGLMHKGMITTYKVESDCNDVTTLGEIIEKDVSSEYIISPEQLEKWKYLKGSKKIMRKKPNGEEYCYSEGAIAFPDHLDAPARTMLTSESTTNRSSHIIAVDEENDIYRTLTPVEAEKIQMFPPDWTNIESKAMTERRRYFMMGNALVVGIVQKLGKYLEKIVEQEN
jgi:DNA (cytosine-5)-methyltransferase 1